MLLKHEMEYFCVMAICLENEEVFWGIVYQYKKGIRKSNQNSNYIFKVMEGKKDIRIFTCLCASSSKFFDFFMWHKLFPAYIKLSFIFIDFSAKYIKTAKYI